MLEDYGKAFDISDTTTMFNIGTIGADLIVDKITMIDFKNQVIELYEERPEWMSSLATFVPFDFKGRRCILPATIDGKDMELFYDSGSSSFGLITSKNRYDKYTDEQIEEIQFDANSWGSTIPIRHKSTNMAFSIGGSELNLRKVSYVEMYTGYARDNVIILSNRWTTREQTFYRLHIDIGHEI